MQSPLRPFDFLHIIFNPGHWHSPYQLLFHSPTTYPYPPSLLIWSTSPSVNLKSISNTTNILCSIHETLYTFLNHQKAEYVYINQSNQNMTITTRSKSQEKLTKSQTNRPNVQKMVKILTLQSRIQNLNHVAKIKIKSPKLHTN